MINISGLGLNFSEKTIFSNANAAIKSGEKIGLIGRNGSGKTTLLNIINQSEDINYQGTVTFTGKPAIGYLPQETDFHSNLAVLEFAKRAMLNVVQIEAQIRSTEKKMENQDKNSESYSQLAIRLSRLFESFHMAEGFSADARASKILSGLGFSTNDLKKPVSSFSGGWQMRAYLAQLLLAENDILLLDEPTNHLDFESLIWIEDFLSSFSVTTIIVSHDYSFLDKIIDSTLAIERGRLIKYSGNISAYEEQRNELIEQLVGKAKSQQEEIERIEKFINRFRYKNTKARQVQSRIKKLEKMEKIDMPESDGPKFEFHFPDPPPVAKDVIHFDNVRFHYPDQKSLLENINIKCYRGEKFALIGKNGAGKSTLVKLIAGLLTPIGGKVKLNGRTRIGYYAQHTIENLNPQNTIYEEISNNADKHYVTKIRDILGLFMFYGDQHYKKIAVLSGGEKARVAIAKLLVSPVNMLVMDEPTNHLDIESKQVIIEAINFFQGTAIIISHDEDLLEQTIENILYLENGELKKYEGNYHQFQEFIRKRVLPQNEQATTKISESISTNQERRQLIKELDREIKKRERQVKRIEAEIELSEKAVEEFKDKMTREEFYLDGRKSHQIQQQINEGEQNIEKLLKEWERIHDEAEAFKRRRTDMD